jgi:MFS family permease
MALGKFLKVPGARELLASKVIDEWIIAVWGTYASLYYVDRMGLRESNISVIQQGSTYVGIFILFLLIPSLTPRFMGRILGLDQLLGLAGVVVLLITGAGAKNPLLACLFAAGLSAVGNALYNSINVSVWMNLMKEKERAKLVAASYAVIRLGLVTGFLGGVLYGKVSPTSLLYAMIVLRLAGFFLLRRVSRIQAALYRRKLRPRQ